MKRPIGKRGGSWLPLVIWFVTGMAAVVTSGGTSGESVAGTLRLQRPEAARAAGARSSGSGSGSLDALPKLREFPHLLIYEHPHPYSRPATPEELESGVVSWDGYDLRPSRNVADPHSPLPPGNLSSWRRERAERLLQARTGEEFLRGLRTSQEQRGLAVAPDTQRICVLRVDFSADTPNERTTGDGRFDLRDSTEIDGGISLDPPPHDKNYFDAHMRALARYYDVQSRGSLVLEWDIWPSENDSALHIGDTFKYGPWIFSNSNPDVLQHAIDLVGDALRAAEASDEAIDFSIYDNWIIFHAGPDFQGDVNRDTPWDIPSFNLGVVEPFVVQDTVEVSLAMVVPETVTQDEFQGAINGVVAHEFGHQLNFFDLYDVLNGLPVVGGFSLMDSGDNQFALIEDPQDPTRNLAVRGTLPGSIDPWHKVIFFGEGVDFIDASRAVDAEGEGTGRLEAALQAVQLDNDIIYVPLNLSEYYLIENRHLDLNADSTVIVRQDPKTGVILGPEPDSSAVADTLGFYEYDWLAPGEGTLVWHIDNLAINSAYFATGGINTFFSRPGVAVVEADGIRDIGTASAEFLGGPYDPFFRGGFSELGPRTRPPSETNDGTPTGVTVSVLDSIGLSMRVAVDLGMNVSGWPVLVGGEPTAEQVLALDLGRSEDPEGGISLLLPARLPDSTVALVEVPEQGDLEPLLLFAYLDDMPTVGMAGSERFFQPGGAAPAVAAVGAGRVDVLDRNGTSLLRWPPDDATTSERVTTTPVLLSESGLVLVGTSEGRIVRLRPGQPKPLASNTVSSDTVAVLGAFRDPDGLRIFWGDTAGHVGVVTNDEATTWSATSATPASRGAPRDPLVVPYADGLRYLFSWENGHLEWRGAAGAVLDGWPVSIGAPLAGSPIVADADQDGSLETVVLDVPGRLHALGETGFEDLNWPRSIWTVDERPLGDQVLAPRAIDVDLDGVPELLVHRIDGFLVAFEGDGTGVDGFPLSFGAPAVHGPEISLGGFGGEPSFVVGNLSGRCGPPCEEVTVVRVPGLGAPGIGAFPEPGLGPERRRAYPAAWIPEPKSLDGDLVEGSVRFYPNPLRSGALRVSFLLGAPAQVELEAFDLSGQKVATHSVQGQAGAQGNSVEWNLSDLASGVYHVRFRATGGSFARELFDKVAIIR